MVLRHHLGNSSLAWRAVQYCDAYTMVAAPTAIATNQFGLVSRPLNAACRRVLDRGHEAMPQRRWSWLLGRPALYLYLAVGAAVWTAWRRRGMAPLVALVPSVGHILGYLVFTPAQDTRYFYYAFLACPMIVAWCIARGGEDRRTFGSPSDSNSS